MNIEKYDVLELLDSLENLVKMNREKVLDAENATLSGFYSGLACAYETCIKRIKEDVLHEKESR